MARLFATASIDNVALSASAKTLIRVAAPSTHGIVVSRLDYTFNGTDAAAAKVLVEFVKGSTSGTATSLTPAKRHGHTGSVAATAQHSFSGEPTGGTVMRHYYVSPAGGSITPDEFVLNPNETLGIRVTGGNGSSAAISIAWEE